mmetsp:Transcript_9485/g.11657  ORF Transcript_9485/g.11657 Transcript_9485/m.11657 type:complete len:200 (-) Transcript_9485:3911-4510(-)
MVLEEEDPNGVPEATATQHFMLAGGAGLLKGELEAFDCVWANIEGTFRLVDDLDLTRSFITAVNVYLGVLHLSLLEQVTRGLTHGAADDVSQVASLLSAGLVDGDTRIAVVIFFFFVLVVGPEDQVRGTLLERTTVKASEVLLLLLSDPSDPLQKPLPLLIAVRPKDEAKANFTLSAYQFRPCEADQVLKQVGESLKHD